MLIYVNPSVAEVKKTCKKILKKLFLQALLLLEVVNFRSRILAFRGACGEPPQRFAPLGVSPVPLIPQDKEGFESVTSHEEN
jgi:hypothetical protein